MGEQIQQILEGVVSNGNCSGCGICASIVPAVSMRLSAEGFFRPVFSGESVANRETSWVGSADRQVRAVRASCPGLVDARPELPGAVVEHPVLGPYLEIWEAWATDDMVRYEGSSGGVLSALSVVHLEATEGASVRTVASGPIDPCRTTAVRITSKAEVAQSAGSRYAPVSVADGSKDELSSAVVGKPCEVSALRRLSTFYGDSSFNPVLMSFFCAGTPSQHSTEQLLESLGTDRRKVSQLRYRGNGWPGKFRAELVDGTSVEASYGKSWGEHLGRSLQWRCRICADGVGMAGDVSVGDYWQVAASGYPTFSESDGTSALVVRTARGQRLVADAIARGMIAVGPIDHNRLGAAQPFQVERSYSLLARLAGRRIAGFNVPSYTGFFMKRRALRHPISASRFFLGTLLRSRKRSSC